MESMFFLVYEQAITLRTRCLSQKFPKCELMPNLVATPEAMMQVKISYSQSATACNYGVGVPSWQQQSNYLAIMSHC